MRYDRIKMGSDLEAANADALLRALALVAKGDDEAAKQAYLEILRLDPTHFLALNELGTLALSGGFRSAARTAYQQAVRHHPRNKIAHVNLANVLREQLEVAPARHHYEMALSIDPHLYEAHQGMAWVLSQLGEEGVDEHLQKGYAGHAVVSRVYRGTGIGVPLLLLVSVESGNIATQLWLTDRYFAVTAIYAEFFDSSMSLPVHELIVNAIGDADLCKLALSRAEQIVARSCAPVINRPARVALTGRMDNSRRLSSIDGVIAPAIRTLSAEALLAAKLDFPLLLRRPGFHNGEHFVRVDNSAALAPTVALLGGPELLAIEYLDVRDADGMVRKYRVMFIDGIAYPLHLAIASDWKVHYIKSEMAHNPAYRDEERSFLEDMQGVLGARAMAALRQICSTLNLEYAGIDFALATDGSVVLFEANATMIVVPPSSDTLWDYRRQAIDNVLRAATSMSLRHASQEAGFDTQLGISTR